ncbi:hypothetical protein JB92DRAFT_2940430 [Gautieria morchelliformis]|nr:hypothetical protein JB92DRAFT_2940430 [Gautieria morchelliformis]
MSQADSLQGPGKPPGTQPLPPLPRKSRAVACAECRRLKLKCDRAFPCLNCRRREVGNLCPHGSLVTRSRVATTVLGSTEGKHDVKWMSERIRQLEEALALIQSKVSDEPHPLLSASHRTSGYSSGSSEQPERATATPPLASHEKGSQKLTSYAEGSSSNGPTGRQTDAADS